MNVSWDYYSQYMFQTTNQIKNRGLSGDMPSLEIQEFAMENLLEIRWKSSTNVSMALSNYQG